MYDLALLLHMGLLLATPLLQYTQYNRGFVLFRFVYIISYGSEMMAYSRMLIMGPLSLGKP